MRYNQFNGIWQALGDGIDNGTNVLSFNPKGELFGGGGFSVAGDKASLNLARWVQPYTAWLPLLAR